MSSEASKEVKTKEDKSDEKNVETSAIAASATTESGAKTDDVQPVAVDDKVAPVEGAADVVPPEKDNDDQDDDGEGEDDHEDPLVIDEAEERSEGADSDEKEFEPTIDMIMNDFDDERTMEEEEALEAEDEADELSALEQEQDMPLEELLKLYNYGGANSGPPEPSAPSESGASKKSGGAPSQERLRDVRPDKMRQDKNGVVGSKTKNPENPDDKPDQDFDPDDTADGSSKSGEKRRNSDSPTPQSGGNQPSKKSRSELARFYEATVEGRALRSTSGGQGGEDVEDEESEAEDSDHEGRDYSWKKTIMIGPTYQASVPADLCYYDDTLPYENEDKKLWDPSSLPHDSVEDYLAKSEESLQPTGVTSLPLGAHIRDDEQALFLLLQCGYNCEEALRRRRMNAIPPADTMSLWSEEECRAFELGLRLYGKDFHMIQQQKVRTRSVGELVQFYYLWKKTERHDVFANSTRLEKKKYSLHPGTTDYMDRFIDEQDASRDRSSSPTTYHSLIFGADTKKGLSILSGAHSKSPGGVSNGDQAIRLSSGVTPSIGNNPNVAACEISVNGAPQPDSKGDISATSMTSDEQR